MDLVDSAARAGIIWPVLSRTGVPESDTPPNFEWQNEKLQLQMKPRISRVLSSMLLTYPDLTRLESGSSNLIVFETGKLPADPTRDLIVVQGLLRTLLFLNREVTC